jgi:hypothetical protein
MLMANTSSLYETLVQVLNQHANGLDFRHLTTLAWMMVGLIHSASISLGAWTPFVVSRAPYSPSTVRRCRRWLDNETIEAPTLSGPLMQPALGGWFGTRLSGALETSLRWHTYWIVRLSVLSRGRALPLVGCVLAQGRATVA